MDPKQDGNAIYKLAWSVLILAGILVASVLAWKWFFQPAGTTGAEATRVAQGNASGSAIVETAQPAATMVVATPSPTPRYEGDTGKGSDVLNRDPDLIERQASMLRAEAAASAKSEAGPSSLALTEERIKQIEKKKLILQ